MVLTVSVALLAVVSIGVSTFAWFQANADVNIQATSDSTTITVSKPEDFVFYAYKGNKNDHTLVNSNEKDLDDDFFTIATSSDLERETIFDGTFVPGSKMVFALQFSNHTSGTQLSLEATDLLSQNVKKALSDNTKSRLDKANDKEINIGWAISIYSTIVASATKPKATAYYSFVNAPSGTDMITLAPNNSGGANPDYQYIGKSNGTGVSLGSTYGNDNYCKAASNIDIYRNNTSTVTAGFIFYAIVFNDAVADRYAETETSAIGDTTPIVIPSTENTRYFIPNSGVSPSTNMLEYNSNCYSGLKFHISAMTFTF